MRALSMEERAELDALLDEVLSQHSTTGDRAHALIAGLEDAIQAHRGWALEALKELAYTGAQRAVKRHARKNAARLATKSGRDKTTIAGRLVVIDGAKAYEQAELTLFSRDDLDNMVRRSARQISAEGENISIAKHLLALLDKHPSATTVADALRAEGTTIEGWLEASAA